MRIPTFSLVMALVLALPALAAGATTEDSQGVAMSENGVSLGVRATAGPHPWVTTPCGGLGVLIDGELDTDVQVILDPGHGGEKDPGAVGANGLTEESVNLRVAMFAKELLQQRGVPTALTRTGDYASRLIVRSRLANASGASLMISIHHNAPRMAPSPDPGVEVFFQSESPESKRLGGIVWEEAMSALREFDVSWVAAPDSGVMTVLNTRGIDAYGMMRFPTVPTALVELGYIANPAEASLFATDEYVRVAAKAVADAAERFLATDDAGSGFQVGRVFNPQPGISSSNCVDPYISGLVTLADWVNRSTPPTPVPSGPKPG